jgi:hypothetical protein
MAINCLFILVSSSLTLGLGIIILVSSAYKTILALLAVALGRSLTYNRKNNGPRIEPCGTPFDEFPFRRGTGMSFPIV